MRVAFALLLLAAFCRAALADSDTLKPATFASLPADFKRALSHLTVRDPLEPKGCLPGDATKPRVCNYRLGDYMAVMASSDKGSDELTIITMICSPRDDAGSARCLLAYSAAMQFAGGEANSETKAKILSHLITGLDFGNEIMVRTDDREFLLQRSMGLWLHIIAADSQQAD